MKTTLPVLTTILFALSPLASAAPLLGDPSITKITTEKIRFDATDNDVISLRRQQNMMAIQKFAVEIDGVTVGGIHSIDGLESESEVIEYKDGEDRTIHTRPGNHKPGKVTITKDWSSTSEFRQWFEAAQQPQDGQVKRKSISIVIGNDDEKKEAKRINLGGCWPEKYRVPGLNAKNSGHATEILEISFERLELK
jgi:phage tail-like protein